MRTAGGVTRSAAPPSRLGWFLGGLRRRFATSSPAFGPLLLGAFVIAQVMDGLLTYRGIAAFGAEIEANPIVSWYVSALGPGNALLAVKAVASACVLPLYARSMHRTIAALIALYIAGAVVPWLNVLWLSR
jgi:hypothetical protein